MNRFFLELGKFFEVIIELDSSRLKFVRSTDWNVPWGRTFQKGVRMVAVLAGSSHIC